MDSRKIKREKIIDEIKRLLAHMKENNIKEEKDFWVLLVNKFGICRKTANEYLLIAKHG